MRDIFGVGRLCGFNIHESPDVPRYELPAEVMPGVPWPPGFRDEINRWARETCGTTNLLPPGSVYVLGNSTIVMRASDVVKIIGFAA